MFVTRECQQQAPFLGVCVWVCVCSGFCCAFIDGKPAARAILLHCMVVLEVFLDSFCCCALVAFMFVALCVCRAEAKTMDRMHDSLGGHFTRIHLPQSRLSTKRVLIMSYLEVRPSRTYGVALLYCSRRLEA